MRDGKIYTEIIPFSGFHLAESYHQKYRLQMDRYLMKEFRAMYPDTDAWVNSTAAARVNGYIGRHGTFSQLQEELGDLGLSPQGEQKLLNIVRQF
jgi:peptide-methionine (S)-S-oxide reductase